MSDSGKVHDRELLDTLEALTAEPFSGTVWRTTWKQRDPLSGSSAGDRWDPPNSFEGLYTSTEADGALAEVYYHLSQAPVFSTCDMLLHKLVVNAESILTLNEELLAQLGVDEPMASRVHYVQTQAISAAARFLEFQGLLVPSVRRECMNLVLFLDQLDLNESISVHEKEPVNWPAWKERQQ